MKAPLKFAVFSVLYAAGERGIWEYDVYELLKREYPARALSKIRAILVEMRNKNWTDVMEDTLHSGQIIRKYRLQHRHREFIEYQLSPQTILSELGLAQLPKDIVGSGVSGSV